MPRRGEPEAIIQEEIELRSGQEWHSEPIHFDGGDVVTVQARSKYKFYAGLFPREEYYRKRNPPNPYRFLWASDRPQFTIRLEISESEYYYLVFRVGVFTLPSPIRIQVLMTKERLA